MVGRIEFVAGDDPFAEVGAARGGWQVSARPDIAIRLKRMFPRANQHRRGYVSLSHSDETCRELVWVMQRWDFEISAADRGRLEGGDRDHRERERVVHEILTGDRPALRLPEPAIPGRDYQLQAADLAETVGGQLCTDEVGLGKTVTGLMLLRNPERLPALVVVPTHLQSHWMKRLGLFFPMLTGHRITQFEPYDPAARRGSHGVDPDVLVIPYSKIRGWGDHLTGKVRTVIFDEVQDLRREGSQKYTAAARIADAAGLRMGLTASPVYNYGDEIFNIMEVLAPGLLGDRSEFNREWCVSIGAGKTAVKDPDALAAYLRDEGVMLGRTRKQVGRELPPVIPIIDEVEYDDDTFDALADDAAEQLAETLLDPNRKPSERFTAGGTLDWKLRHATGVAKAPYVAAYTRILAESERVVLFGWHRDVYEIWLKQLAEFNPVLYTGSESPTQKDQAAEAFINGDSRILIMSLRSGVGLDGLQEVCKVAVFGELDWSPAVMEEQCVGRLRRDGQVDEESVVAHYLIANGGADPVMAEALEVKRQQAEPFTAAGQTGKAFTTAVSQGDRMKVLARDFLSRRRRGARPADELRLDLEDVAA